MKNLFLTLIMGAWVLGISTDVHAVYSCGGVDDTCICGAGNPYGADLSDMTAAYSPRPHTVVVEFESESYWHLHTIGYKPIIPKQRSYDPVNE